MGPTYVHLCELSDAMTYNFLRVPAASLYYIVRPSSSFACNRVLCGEAALMFRNLFVLSFRLSSSPTSFIKNITSLVAGKDTFMIQKRKRLILFKILC